MRPATYYKQLIEADPDYFFTSASSVAAGDLTLLNEAMDDQRRVSITSAASDESDKDFTITGIDGSGNTIEEVIAGPIAGGQVATELDFFLVTNINLSAATTGGIDIGSHESGSTPPIRIDQFADPVAVSLALEFHDEDSDVNASVQYCFDEGTSTRTGPFHWFDHGDIHLRTENTTGALINPVTAIRLLVNSGTSRATLHVVQAASH